MKQLLTKSFADIDQSDIDRLINNAEEESNGLEIKGPLPGVDVAKEPWQKGINEIKDENGGDKLVHGSGRISQPRAE